jgi:6-phosphogluconolactonase
MRLTFLIVLFAAAAIAAPKRYLVYFGSYTGEKSKGIYVSRFDAAHGKLEPPILAAEIVNPSFLAPHPNGRFLYAVSEEREGSVSAFSIDPATGKLTLLNKVSSRGRGPCYARVDKTGKTVLIANYSSGSFAVLPIDADGRLREASAVIQDSGAGSNPSRQEGPHAHSLNPSPDNRFAIGADLGLDKLFIFKFDAGSGSLVANEPPPFASWQLKPGDGPRHFAFHPKGRFAYVTNELSSTVVAFSFAEKIGELRALQTVSTLPADFKGENSTADVQVHPSGKFLYDSNRGADSIAVFKISRKGILNKVDDTPTQGKVPRGFGIDPTGSFLIAANQKSDTVVVFRIDKSTGRLTPTGQTVEIGSPVCVKFVGVK